MIAGFAIAVALGFEDESRFRSWFEATQSRHGRALAAIALTLLLAVDLVLPLPSSALMMLSGSLFGTTLGTAISFVGSTLSATLGFAVCRRIGVPAFTRVCGEAETSRLSASLARLSPWLVLLTRAAPMLAELAACLAGLAAWSLWRFLGCVALGTAPVAWIYAAAGANARDASGVALAVGIGLPILGFLLGALALGRRVGGP